MPEMESEPYVLVRRWRREHLVSASVHRRGCRMTPPDGSELRDGTRLSAEGITHDQARTSVVWAADQHVEADVGCRFCGGWREE